MPKGENRVKPGSLGYGGPKPVRKKAGRGPHAGTVRVREGSYYGQRPSTPASTRSAYTTPEYIPGIKHVVEGRSDLVHKTAAVDYEKSGMARDARGYKPSKEYGISRKSKADKRAAGAYNAGVDEQIKGFGLEDEARSRIRTIADPEEVKLRERKRAARRRMRGRLGTLLTERQTLG